MSIVRVHKTANFTVMSNAHFKEKHMSLKAKGLLSLMLSLPDDWNYSIAGLVSLSKDGKDSVMSALSELEKFGYLKRIRLTNSKGQFAGVEYHIFEQPQTEVPVSENQNEEKQNAGKSNSENQPLLNTNKIKDLNNKITNELTTKEEDHSYLSQFNDILNHIKDLELKNLYIDYIEMRKQNDFPLTKRGLSMLMNRCARLANFDRKIQIQLLETAIINNWKNVYLPKENEEPTRYQKDAVYDELRRFYDGDD